MTVVFYDEPHDPSLNYKVVIQGSDDRKSWLNISKPMTCNDALNLTQKLHGQYKFLRFEHIKENQD